MGCSCLPGQQCQPLKPGCWGYEPPTANNPTTASASWVVRSNGDIWSSDNPKTAHPIAYQVGDGWMVAGIRSPAELQAIVAMTQTAAWARALRGWDVGEPLAFWNVG